MYIHLGEETVILAKEIVAILDKDSVNESALVKEFLEHQHELTESASKPFFKSVVVTLDKVYFSAFSSGTIKKRVDQANRFDFKWLKNGF